MLQEARVIVTSAVPGATEREVEGQSNEVGQLAPRRSNAMSVAQLMRQLLDLARPRSDAEALRLLRQAFPSASLADRVTAMAERTRS